MGAQQSLSDMEQRFAQLWQRLLPADSDADYRAAWNALEEGYCEPWRQYHSARHIAFCLREFDQVKTQLKAPDEVEMALWFHDAVMSQQADDNEARSADLFRQYSQGLFGEEFQRNVCDLIMATTHDAQQTGDAGFVRDIDLAGLGLNWDSFLDDGIRLKGESPKSSAEYSVEKLQFFRRLLERPHVYMTDSFRQRYENGARDNIHRMMALLESNLYC